MNMIKDLQQYSDSIVKVSIEGYTEPLVGLVGLAYNMRQAGIPDDGTRPEAELRLIRDWENFKLGDDQDAKSIILSASEIESIEVLRRVTE